MPKELKIVGVTGHRRLKHNPDSIKKTLKEKLRKYETEVVVTGMALGFDMLVAETCIEEQIPFVAAIPCHGQTKAWPISEKDRYMSLMQKAWKSTVVSKGPFAIWKLFERNKWIVNRSNIILSYWDGGKKGGTAATVRMARKFKKTHENLFFLC